jgi:uncharacterized membrane protein YeiH
VVVAGDALGLASTPTAVTGAALCFGLRMAAIRLGWHLPVARTPGQTGPGSRPSASGEHREDR